MGQLANTWDRRWKVYFACNNELPTDLDLTTIKALVFPGSAHAAYDETNLFVPIVSDFIRKVFTQYQDIKLFGSCFGH